MPVSKAAFDIGKLRPRLLEDPCFPPFVSYSIEVIPSYTALLNLDTLVLISVIPRSYESVYGTELLLKADPGVTYYDDPDHRQALWSSLVVIFLLILVIPLYIVCFSSGEVSKLQIRYRNLTQFVVGLDELLRSRGGEQPLQTREELREALSDILKQKSITLEVYTTPRSWTSSLRSICNLSSSHKFERVTSFTRSIGNEQVDVLVSGGVTCTACLVLITDGIIVVVYC